MDESTAHTVTSMIPMITCQYRSSAGTTGGSVERRQWRRDVLVLRRSARRDRGLLPLAAGGRGGFRGGVQSVPEEHGLRRQEAQAGQPITARSVAALGEIEIEAEEFRGSVSRLSRLAVAAWWWGCGVA